MNTITLCVKNAPCFRVDGSKLLPATLAAASSAELPHIVLQGVGETCALGDLFYIAQADAGAPSLTIEGDAQWLDRIGAHMVEGTLKVHGRAGDYADMKMSGGELQIHGDAGLFAACEMAGGRLTVQGNAGDFAAAALPGDMEGITGGTLAIHGSAGARLADRMRRGTVLVGGDAGTVCIGGKVGAYLGYDMRHGRYAARHGVADKSAISHPTHVHRRPRLRRVLAVLHAYARGRDRALRDARRPCVAATLRRRPRGGRTGRELLIANS